MLRDQKPPTPDDIRDFLRQAYLPLGTPCLDVVPKKNIHSMLPSEVPMGAITEEMALQMVPFILMHGLLDCICVDENNCILAGFETIEKAKSEKVDVKRILGFNDLGKMTFVIAHSSLLAKFKKEGE